MLDQAESLLSSAPWTPRVEQDAFKSTPEPMLDTTGLAEYNFDFSAPNSTFWSLQTTPLDIGRADRQGHKRYTSFPLTTVTRKEKPTLHTHSRTMSCITPQWGLGISFLDGHCSSSKDETVTTMASTSSLSDALPSTPIKEEDDMSDDAIDSPIPTTNEMVVKTEQPLTAAEMRAEKRKMKRFRLNHQQTRYLMSEFARQAHPDASQREKLSRAIPGLSPRQVQVWFQNRRAKLKRVTQDDRDSIVRSRALPEDFDLSSALASPFSLRRPHPVLSLTQTSLFSSPPDYEVTPLASTTPQMEQSHRHASSLYACTQSATTDDNCSLNQNVCNSFSPTLPFSFEVMAAEARDSGASEKNSGSLHIDVSSVDSPYTPQSSLFASPFDASFHVSTPEISPYGLGFTYGDIPGFQAASIQTVRNHARLPGKVRIPRWSSGTMLYTPIYTSTTCSPVVTSLGFPVLSAPAGVTSFPSYIQ